MRRRANWLYFIIPVAVTLSVASQVRAQSVDLSDNYNLGYRSLQTYTPHKIGKFNVGGSIENSIGYDDNVFEVSQDKEDGHTLNTSLNVWMNSNWNKHAFRFSAYANKSHFPGHTGADEDYANLFSYGRLDLPSNMQLEVVTNYQYDEDDRGPRRFVNNPVKTTADHSLDTKVFFSKGFGDLAITARAGIKFGLYPDAKTNNGNPLNRDDENHRLYDLRLRGSLNVGEKSNVYLEGGYNRWVFEDRIDRNGFERGSKGFHLAAGWIFNPTSSLSGEIAVGYRYQSFNNNNFSKLSTLTLDAWTTWAVTNRFNLTATADTRFREETNFAEAASLYRSFSVQADYRLQDRIRAFAISYYELEDKISSKFEDHTLQGTLGVNYEILQGIVATAQFQHKRVYNGGNGSDYMINRVWSGLKFYK